MRNGHLVDTIKKLLRLAKTGTENEAAVAAARAQELMAKYQVQVSDEDCDEYRQKVESVAGLFWREQILTAAAKRCFCKVLRQQIGNRAVAVVTGDRQAVEMSIELYSFVFFEITTACIGAWGEYASRQFRNEFEYFERLKQQAMYEAQQRAVYESQDRYEDVLGAEDIYGAVARTRSRYESTFAESIRLKAEIVREQRERAEEAARRPTAVTDSDSNDPAKLCAPIWFRAFLDSAAVTFFQGVAKAVPKRITPTYGNEAAPKKDPKEDEETKKLVEGVNGLADKIGMETAARLHERAKAQGVQCAKNLATGWKRKHTRQLTAASSWLPVPPPPSRFNQIDLDVPTVEAKAKPGRFSMLEVD